MQVLLFFFIYKMLLLPLIRSTNCKCYLSTCFFLEAWAGHKPNTCNNQYPVLIKHTSAYKWQLIFDYM